LVVSDILHGDSRLHKLLCKGIESNTEERRESTDTCNPTKPVSFLAVVDDLL
jgi:hypothetical protein